MNTVQSVTAATVLMNSVKNCCKSQMKEATTTIKAPQVCRDFHSVHGVQKMADNSGALEMSDYSV